MKIYEDKAIRYAEHYGIIDYKVKNNTMIYYEKHVENVGEKPRKYKYTVNLDTMMGVEVKELYKRK